MYLVLLRIERDPWVITGWDIRQYSFCPLIPWLRSNYGIEEPPTYSMELGRELCIERRELIASELRVPKPWRFEVMVENYDLGIAGKIDLLGGSKWFAVVEVKGFRRCNFSHFLNQLLFYTYLVNSTVGPVRYSYLVLGDEVRKYVVGDYELSKVRKLISRVRRIKLSNEPPQVVKDVSKCLGCWYSRYCSFLIS